MATRLEMLVAVRDKAQSQLQTMGEKLELHIKILREKLAKEAEKERVVVDDLNETIAKLEAMETE